MSVRAECIAKILCENHKLSKYPLPQITWDDLRKSPLYTALSEIYTKLGGTGSMPDAQLIPYDISFEDIAIQLDEERSFNRYRGVTLQSEIYGQLKHFPLEKIKSYCRNFETECLKSASHGKMWSSTEAEKLFGKPGEPGELHQHGAPVWRYKAFQDFLLDLTTLVLPVKLIRFSIYDNLLINGKMYRLSEVVISSRPDFKSALSKHLERRIQSLSAV